MKFYVQYRHTRGPWQPWGAGNGTDAWFHSAHTAHREALPKLDAPYRVVDEHENVHPHPMLLTGTEIAEVELTNGGLGAMLNAVALLQLRKVLAVQEQERTQLQQTKKDMKGSEL